MAVRIGRLRTAPKAPETGSSNLFCVKIGPWECKYLLVRNQMPNFGRFLHTRAHRASAATHKTSPMTNEIQKIQDAGQQGEIILYQPDETVRIEVRLEGETVWLTQQQMALLFDKDRTVIGRHIRNIYKECELEPSITCAKFAHMGSEGDQLYEYTAYNLDVIISVGYRVKSKRGTMFRQWASKVLKEYLLRGYAVNQRMQQMKEEIGYHLYQHERRLDALEGKMELFVQTSLPPVVGIFHQGQVFSARLDELWHCGASFKDLGRKLFAIDRLSIDKNIILNQL